MTASDPLTLLGARLRGAGLTEQALLAWSGTHRLSVLAHARPMSRLAARPPLPAAAALALFVGGAELAIDRVKTLPIDALVDAGLLERAGDHVRAAVAVLPLSAALLVCDRHDAPDHEELVCWPDDSSYHLASALDPGRRPRWIDLACGSAFAPLAHPELGAEIAGFDLNPRAVRYARLGAALTGCRHLTSAVADIGVAHAPAELVTCNAPILGDPDASIWRRAERTFFERMWPTARACVAPGGEIVVHSTLDAVPGEDTPLPGQVISVVYSPPGERAFAVTWWTPDAPACRIVAQRTLTAGRPHLEPRDREAALAGQLPPLGPSGSC